MKRLGRALALVSWLTALTLLPVPWEQLARLELRFPPVAWASPQFRLPFAELFGGNSATVRPSIPTFYPPERVVLQQPGAKSLGSRAGLQPKPKLDVSEGQTRGPGITLRLEAPAEPVLEVDLRLRGVPGRQARQEPGGRHVYDLPADGAAQSQGPRSLLVTDDDLLAQAATRTPGAAQAGTPTRTPAASASLTPTAATTGTPAATATATTTGASPTATSQPSGPQSGNRYGARIELRYEETPDGGVKETLRFLDRPRLNIVEYELDARGLTVTPQADGSLRLLDHAGRHVFTIPAPSFEDARGQKGSASYRLTDKKLEVILDQRLIDTGALPLEVDPSILTGTNLDLLSSAAAPWQRQSVVTTDGTQVFFYYDPTSGSTGIKFKISTDNFASVSSTATTVVADQGAGGFSVEIERGLTSGSDTIDKIYLAMTGTFAGSPATNALRLYPVSYNLTTKAFSVGAAINVASNTATWPKWSGASVAVERAGSTRYLWVGGEEQSQSSGNRYTYKAWWASLSADGTPGGWTETNPSLTASATSYAHYGALVALHDGVAAVGRGLDGGAQRQVANLYVRGSGWGTVAAVAGGSPAYNNGREFTLLAVYDPLSQPNNVVAYRPMVAIVGTNNDDGGMDPISLHVLRYGQTTWTSVTGPTPVATVRGDQKPQLVWDGVSFYLFRAKKNGSSDFQVNGQRGKLTGGQQPAVELDPDRPWVIPGTGDKNVGWLGLPRLLGSEIVPFFYIADRASDELFVEAKKLNLLGERRVWEYQELKIPGAGLLKVNRANGNLHYEMTDADFASRKWQDSIKRIYDAQSDISTGMGLGWTGLHSPRVKFYDANHNPLATSDGQPCCTEMRVDYWAEDGAVFTYLKDAGGGTGNWKPELGMKMTLDKRINDLYGAWRLTDLYGRTIYFDSAGRPVRKWDKEGTGNAEWVWTYNGSGEITTITGVKKTDGNPGRTQKYYYTNGQITKITIANPGVNPDTCTSTNDCYSYLYAYTNGRLTEVTLVSNSSEFSGSNAVKVRYEYNASGRLSAIRTPEDSRYEIGYDGLQRVAYVDLPHVSSANTAVNCNRGSGRHCWEFAYVEASAGVTVTDPRGNTWEYKALGSGPIYEYTYPIGTNTNPA